MADTSPTRRQTAAPEKVARVTPSKSVLVCALGLLAAFFMPWVQLFGVGMSGYNLGQLGSYGNYAWVIPILAGATILCSFTGVNNRVIGAIAGIVPLGAILYGLIRLGGEGGHDATNGVLKIAGQVLSVGAWLTIIFSIVIIIEAVFQTPPARARNRSRKDLRTTDAFQEAAAASPEQHTGSVSEELTRLADLHAKGILDADEFKAAKAKLLA